MIRFIVEYPTQKKIDGECYQNALQSYKVRQRHKLDAVKIEPTNNITFTEIRTLYFYTIDNSKFDVNNAVLD